VWPAVMSVPAMSRLVVYNAAQRGPAALNGVLCADLAAVGNNVSQLVALLSCAFLWPCIVKRCSVGQSQQIFQSLAA